MAEGVLMPKEGITVESCIIGEWKKNVGDHVNVGDVLFTYETDKAEFECESTAAGTLIEKFYEDGDEIVSIWKPRPEYQGWLNTLHGGIQSVLLDEICGWVVFRKLQTGGVTSKMETRFRKSISTNDTHLVLRASLREQKRNIAVIEARLYNSMGELCTEATCTYFTFPQEKAEKEMCFHHCDVEPDEILPLV